MSHFSLQIKLTEKGYYLIMKSDLQYIAKRLNKL
jgi:hypothetical protein